jgi:outer membrane protein OmpA-like peptidoglycan-associated protein
MGAMIMAVTRFLVFAIIVAALLPAGREMLDDLVREFSGTKQQAVLNTGQSERIGSAGHNQKPSERGGW